MYLVKIHNVYNYRNYHEFGKQDCLCACVYVWRVGPEPVGARQWPWKPRTWGDSGAALRCHNIERLSLKRSCLLTGTECYFGERTVTYFYFRALVRVHLCSPNPPSNAALAFPSENLSWLPPAHWGRDLAPPGLGFRLRVMVLKKQDLHDPWIPECLAQRQTMAAWTFGKYRCNKKDKAKQPGLSRLLLCNELCWEKGIWGKINSAVIVGTLLQFQ